MKHKYFIITFTIVAIHSFIFYKFTSDLTSAQYSSSTSKNSIEVNIKTIHPKFKNKQLTNKKVSHSQSSISGVKTDAQSIGDLNPNYPHLSRVYKEEGFVKISVQIDPQGIATSSKLILSSGHKRLDQEALKTALNSKYTPAKNEYGTNVFSTLELIINFSPK